MIYRAGRRPLRSSVAPIFDAVGKGDGRRAVPRLHDRGMIFVKCPFVFADMVLGAESLGHHHHHGMLHRAAAQDEEFEDIVEDAESLRGVSMMGSSFVNGVAEERGRRAWFPARSSC